MSDDDSIPDNLRARIEELMARKRAKFWEAKERLQPKWITGNQERIKFRYVIVRSTLTYLTAFFCFVAIIACFQPSAVAFALSICSVLSGFVSLLLLCSEIFSGAGVIELKQFFLGDSTYRELSFRPYINTIGELLGHIAIGAAAILVGYAGVYTYLSSLSSQHFGVSLDGFKAIFYSVFTSAAYGDVSPTSTVAFLLIASQLAVSWVLTVFVLATTITWGISQESNRNSERIERRREEMQITEMAMKEAGLGLYMDPDLVKEIIDTLNLEGAVRAGKSDNEISE